MSTSFDLAEALVEFAVGSEANWNSFQLPIPNNVVIFTTDSQKFKRGNGTNTYAELPDGPTLAGIAAGGQEVLNVLTTLIPTDTDGIIVIDNEIYEASATKLTDIMARITAIANKDTVQDANLATVASQFTMVDQSIISGDTSKLAVVGNHKMKPGVLPDSMIVVTPPPAIHIRSFGIYSDKNCTIPCDTFYRDSTYYAKIEACHDTADTDDLTITLNETNAYITPVDLGRGLFKINVGKPAIAENVVLTATATYNTDTVSKTKTVSLVKYEPILVGLYGGAYEDRFGRVVIDSQGNIITVGYTNSETIGYQQAIIVKFDSNLNIIARKAVYGANNDVFNDVCVDSNNNIFVCGWYWYDSNTAWNALVQKFDTNLNIIAQRTIYGTAAYEEIFQGITIDSSNNVYCCGYTYSEGNGAPGNCGATIYKFDNDLNVVLKKIYHGASANDVFYGASTDLSNNIIITGYTASEGSGGYDALIIKFDSNLNILAKKRYGGTGDEVFHTSKADASGNIYAVGFTASEGSGSNDALIIKFDSNLNILAKKRYGGVGDDRFFKVAFYSSYIFVSLLTKSCGSGDLNAAIVKFDTNLNIVGQKLFTRYGDDGFNDIVTDSNGNIYCSGYSTNMALNYDATIVKIPANFPSGTLVGTILTDVTFSDFTALTLANSNLTLADSNLSYSNSGLTVASTGFTYANSVLAYTKDSF